MTTLFRTFVLIGALVASSVHAQTAGERPIGTGILLPLDDGHVLIQKARFIRLKVDGNKAPGLAFSITNYTSSPWRRIHLQFEIDYECSGREYHRSQAAVVSVNWLKNEPVTERFLDPLILEDGDINQCKDQKITAKLVSADSQNSIHIDGATGERVDMAERIRVENERALAEQAKRNAEEAEIQRLERLAELKAEAKEAKDKAAERAKAKRDRARIWAACSAIYKKTADMKLKDLTVTEEQHVRTCQALGLYPPR